MNQNLFGHEQKFQVHPDREGVYRRIDPFVKFNTQKAYKAHICTHCKNEIEKGKVHIYCEVKGRFASGRGSIRRGRFCDDKCFNQFFGPDAISRGLQKNLLESGGFLRTKTDRKKGTPVFRPHAYTIEYLLLDGWRVLPNPDDKPKGEPTP